MCVSCISIGNQQSLLRAISLIMTVYLLVGGVVITVYLLKLILKLLLILIKLLLLLLLLLMVWL